MSSVDSRPTTSSGASELRTLHLNSTAIAKTLLSLETIATVRSLVDLVDLWTLALL